MQRPLIRSAPEGAFERVALPGADLRYSGDAYAARADALLAALREEIPWERHRLRLFGREVDAPRLSSWIGDADAVYAYSRARFVPHAWTPTLAALREDLEIRCGARFNSVLANLYRDGRDAMGWHSDDEPELGADPVIASLSFGAVRRFRLREKDSGRTFAIDLEHGSLLVMAGATQRRFRHDVPKTRRPVGERINLTFRRILPSARLGFGAGARGVR